MKKATRVRNHASQATDDDVFYAYRLLLGREPDPAGWEAHRRLIAREPITCVELVRNFMASPEFLARNIGARGEGSIVEVSLDGFSLFVRSDDRDIGAHIRTTRKYEPHVTAAMRELLHAGNVVVDVGANIGFFSNLAASIVGNGGLIVAVEPLDKNRQLLFRSLERNGFNNVRVHACAAADHAGMISITTDPGTSNGQPLGKGVSDQHALFAQTERLDDLTASLPRIDLVKMDIDGYELLAWGGFRHSLEKHRPVVLTEFHPYGMRKFVGVDPLDYLKELFAYGESVHVLRFEGGRTACATPSEVMHQWENVNEMAGTDDGRVHLDLQIQPRR